MTNTKVFYRKGASGDSGDAHSPHKNGQPMLLGFAGNYSQHAEYTRMRILVSLYTLYRNGYIMSKLDFSRKAMIPSPLEQRDLCHQIPMSISIA